MHGDVKKLGLQFQAIIYKYYAIQQVPVEIDCDVNNVNEFVEIEMQLSSPEDLKKYIEDSNNPNKDHRKELMEYVLEGFKLIYALLQQKTPQDNIESVKQALSQLLINLKNTKMSPKRDTKSFNIHETTYAKIQGCLGCNSGDILEKQLGCILEKSSEDIQKYVSELIDRQQQTLAPSVMVETRVESSVEILMKQEEQDDTKNPPLLMTFLNYCSTLPANLILGVSYLIETSGVEEPELDEAQLFNHW